MMNEADTRTLAELTHSIDAATAPDRMDKHRAHEFLGELISDLETRCGMTNDADRLTLAELIQRIDAATAPDRMDQLRAHELLTELITDLEARYDALSDELRER
jgi:hypothetical protein